MKGSMIVSGFIALIIFCVSKPISAEGFSFTFEWGDIPKCGTGRSNTVPNPIFTLSNVPEETVEIYFSMIDRHAHRIAHVPGFSHGGGTVTYAGEQVIQPGAFKYKSPCPPGKAHTYVWTAKVRDGNGNTISKATAKRQYPD
jgi:hypothetical protein|tara:strand:+ start:302 stop:727 length:426 start_codon:yes stop_codon:yes gene_type:complete